MPSQPRQSDWDASAKTPPARQTDEACFFRRRLANLNGGKASGFSSASQRNQQQMFAVPAFVVISVQVSGSTAALTSATLFQVEVVNGPHKAIEEGGRERSQVPSDFLGFTQLLLPSWYTPQG